MTQKQHLQKDEHLLEVCRYVVLNPVCAGMVARVEDWIWSSYRATAGWEPPHSCLTTDLVLGQFGGERVKAEKEYRQFVRDRVGKESVWSGVKGQAVLAGSSFFWQPAAVTINVARSMTTVFHNDPPVDF